MSGAFGYRFFPISVSPLPLLAWQIAQWSAKCARASARFSGVFRNGFLIPFAPAGTARLRVALATNVSVHDGLSRALKPRRMETNPNAAAPTTPAAVIDRRRVRFVMCLPLLRACAHLKWDVDLAHRLVDSAWLRRSFEAVRKQV